MPPLVSLRRATLTFPAFSNVSEVSPPPAPIHESFLGPLNLNIEPASSGGHALIGPNGSGKTLLASYLQRLYSKDLRGEWLARGGCDDVELSGTWNTSSCAAVSFESHEALLETGGVVIGALGGHPLSDSTKYLVSSFRTCLLHAKFSCRFRRLLALR